MSMFDNITKVIATNSGLYKFPNGNQLPKNIKNLSISNNCITDFTFDGFGSLNDLEVILAIGNPINKINVDNVVSTIKNNPNIVTIKFGDDIKKISNYDEYIQKLEALEEEISDEHFPMIDPFTYF